MNSRRTVAIAGAFLCLASGTLSSEEVPVSTRRDPASTLINGWFKEGAAAGLKGIHYDNRDRGHSRLAIESYPQLTAIEYTEEEVEQRLDWGGPTSLRKGKVVIGNSSTSSPVTREGSNQRRYYSHPKGLSFLYNQYRSNALYIYPESQDHDAEPYGDLYPAISPYLVTSQGSSGSDQPFLHAFVKTIAAFRPKVREDLVAKGLLMPTLQAIFRQSNHGVRTVEDYLSGAAHPSAFDGGRIDEVRMVTLAHGIAPGTIPPIVRLRVLREKELENGRDFFEPEDSGRSGKLHDSPCAIARVVRGPDYLARMRVSAAGSIDPQDRPLRFEWVVLRGDPARITIEVDEDGTEADLAVGYHHRRPIAPGSVMASSRVDIGVFAAAGDGLVSAPAFLSFCSLANEHRTYAEDGRLLEIFYGARSEALGLPAPGSERWDVLLSLFDRSGGGARGRIELLAGALAPDQRSSLEAAAAGTSPLFAQIDAASARLEAIKARQQKLVDVADEARLKAAAEHVKRGTEASRAALDQATDWHRAAATAMRDGDGGARVLEEEITGLRARVTAVIRDRDLPGIVRSGLDALRTDHRFYDKNEAAIRAAVAVSQNSSASAELTAALRRAESIGALDLAEPAPNDRYHLEQLNLAILADVLFPDFLQHPAGPLYVDPTLTASKSWRDVYHHDENGAPTGWTRHHDGKRTEFTAGGNIIRSRNARGEPENVRAVRYGISPQTKRLEFVPVEDLPREP